MSINSSKLNLDQISLIVYDFDGVMTNNKVILSEDGTESIVVSRADGLAIDIIKKHGIRQLILSTETNQVVSKRAKKLNIECINSIGDKKAILLSYCKKNNIPMEKVVYFGNDINDLEAMKCVGYPSCPSDAYKEIKEVSKLVMKTSGGNGVVREFLDYLNINS